MSYVGGITSLHGLLQVSGRDRVRRRVSSVAKAEFVLMLMLMPTLIRLKNSRSSRGRPGEPSRGCDVATNDKLGED